MRSFTKKTSKKLLSVILALCCVISCMCQAFSVVAVESPYEVKSSSPAIPMNAFTVVSYGALAVETEDGLKLGNALTFENKSGSDGIKVDNAKQTITAYDKGVYEVEATDTAGNKTTLYVVVKNKNESSWIIYDVDFTDGETHSDWSSMFRCDNQWCSYPAGANYLSNMAANNNAVGNGGVTVTGVTPYTPDYTDSENNITYSGWGGSVYYFLNNKVVSSFSDYTVNSEFWGMPGYHGGYGLLGRINLDQNSKFTNSVKFTGYYGWNGYGRDQSTENGVYLWEQLYSSDPNKKTNKIDTWKYLQDRSKNASTTLYYHKFKSVYNGTSVTLSSPEDTEKKVFEQTSTVTQRGTVGFLIGVALEKNNTDAAWLNKMAFTKVSVSLNNTESEKPAAAELELYTVSDAAPAIPMIASTQVDASEFVISLNGSSVLANKCTFENVSGSNGIAIDGKIIKAYQKGSYKVKVTSGDITDYIWVVVKDRNDDEYVLYETDFSNEATLKDWKAMFLKSGTYGTFPVGTNYQQITQQVKSEFSSGWQPFTIIQKQITTSAGVKKTVYAYDYTDTAAGVDTNVWGLDAFFFSTNEVFEQFSDYTVRSKFIDGNGYHAGFSLMGRVTLNSNKAIDSSSAATGLYIDDGFGRVDSVKTNNDGTQTVENDTRGGVYAFDSTPTGSLNENYKTTNMINNKWWWYMRRGTLQYIMIPKTVDVTTVFDGENMTVYSESDLKNETYSAQTTNTRKGTFGFAIGTLTGTHDGTTDHTAVSQIFSFNSVKVTLNENIAVPDAQPMPLEAFVQKNRRFDLKNLIVGFDSSTYVTGDDISWSAMRNEIGEVSNGVFTAFSEGDTQIVANYNGKTAQVTVHVTGYSSGTSNVTQSEPFANEYVTVKPDSSVSTRYTIIVTTPENTELKVGSLKVSENGSDFAVIEATDKTGTKFAYETAAIGTLTVALQTALKTDSGIAALGATIRYATDGKQAGIRFGNRFSVIKYATEDKASLGERQLTVEDKVYTLDSVGSILAPKYYLDTNNEELTVKSKNVVKQQVSSVVSATDNFADAAIVLNLGTAEQLEARKDIVISSRGYMLFKAADGSEHYVYGDVIERSYTDVINKIPTGNYENIAQSSWESLLSSPLSGTDFESVADDANLRALALKDQSGKGLVKTEVFKNSDGAYEIIYSGRKSAGSSETFTLSHTLYADSDYYADFTDTKNNTKYLSDIYFAKNSQTDVTYQMTTDGLKIVARNDNRPLSAFVLPAYQSGSEYVFEADIVMTGKHSAVWATLNFAVQAPDVRLNAWMKQSFSSTETLFIAKRIAEQGTSYQSPAYKTGTTPISNKVADLITSGELDSNKFNINDTSYSVKNDAVMNYRIVVSNGSAYYYIDDVLVSSIEIDDDIPLNGFFGLSTTTVDLLVKNFRVSSNTNPSEISINSNPLSSYKIVIDTADESAVYAAKMLNEYLKANAGYTLPVSDHSKKATDFEIVLGNTSRKASSLTGENVERKYKGELDENKFYIFFGDEQSAEMAIEEFTSKVIGKESSAYVLGNMSINVTSSVTHEFSGQWEAIQSFVLFTDTHIGRCENGQSTHYSTGIRDNWDNYAPFVGQAALATAYKNYLEAVATGNLETIEADLYYQALQSSHTELIAAFKHAVSLNPDFIAITGDVTETGYGWFNQSNVIYDSKRCWDAYNFVLNKAFGEGTSSQTAYSISKSLGLSGDALNSYKTGVPIYDMVGNHDTWNGSGTYDVANPSQPTDDTQFLRDYLWYTEKNGKKVANVSFDGTYGSPKQTLSDEDYNELEANLKAAREADSDVILVYCHYALFGNVENQNGFDDASSARIAALCKKYGAEVYMHGHVHNENWQTTSDGSVTNVDVGWTNDGFYAEYGGTYALVTVTDRRVIYTIYAAEFDDSSSANSSDYSTKTPVKTVTIKLNGK